MRQPTVHVRLSGGTVTTSDTTRRPAIVSEGQQKLGLGRPTAATIVRTTGKSGEYRR